MIGYISDAFCPVAMVAYILVGAWLIRLSLDRKQQLLFLLGIWAWLGAAQIMVSLIPSYFSHLPYIGPDFAGSEETANTLVLCLSFGATICLGWAAVLALQNKFCIETSGSFVDWIAGAAAIVALVLPQEARSFCKELDTSTSVVAVSVMGVALILSGGLLRALQSASWLRWAGSVLWFVHALMDAFWYIVEKHLVDLANGGTLIFNVLATLPPVSAVIITGVIFRNAIPRHPTNLHRRVPKLVVKCG